MDGRPGADMGVVLSTAKAVSHLSAFERPSRPRCAVVSHLTVCGASTYCAEYSKTVSGGSTRLLCCGRHIVRRRTAGMAIAASLFRTAVSREARARRRPLLVSGTVESHVSGSKAKSVQWGGTRVPRALLPVARLVSGDGRL